MNPSYMCPEYVAGTFVGRPEFVVQAITTAGCMYTVCTKTGAKEKHC